MSNIEFKNPVDELERAIAESEGIFTYEEYIDLNNKFGEVVSYIKERNLFIEFAVDIIKKLKKQIAELEGK